MKTSVAIALLTLILNGCATPQTYTGTVTDCQDNPIARAEVEAWENEWIPFHLPGKLGETKTDENGTFTLSTEKEASFFVYSGSKLVFTSHSGKSETKCAKNST
ncbi:hypothetical protein [Microbulbifer sp. JMSA003]|uniref:hypothetical protein n=1 Tax=Microbulbifer sp. JMSA003 TaxID=3243369 RepID=UPI00403A5374